jgi:hypothetical protein
MNRVTERKFVIETPAQRDRLAQFIGRLEAPFQCETGPVREQRSLSANSRLWALHGMAARHTGHSPDELHELMLCKFFGTREIEVGGMTRTVPLKRSSTREKKEFGEFMESVENFYAAELGLWLDQREAA